MRPKPLLLARALLGVASLAVTACSGASNPLHDGVDAASTDEGGATDAPEAGGSTTCGAAVACGASGSTYAECTEVGASGVCSAIVYEVSSGKSFTCAGCSNCGSTQQALSSYCASNPVVDAGPGEGGVLDATVDASDGGAHPDGGAPEASPGDGGDGGLDASDGGTHLDGSAHDASAEGGGGDGGVEAGCTPGATQCVGTEIQMCGSNGQWGSVESDPIWAVEASASSPDGGLAVMNYDGSNGEPAPTASGLAPTGGTVTFDVWTAPGVAFISVMYWLDAASGSVSAVPLGLSGTNGIGLDRWSGTLPAQSSGTSVTWWAQGTDVCHAGTDYYSNGGNNYSYETQ